MAEAEAEGNKAALMSFKNAMAVEGIHHGLYSAALEAVQSGKDLCPSTQVYVCQVCGNTVYGEAPDVCPICGVKKEKFTEIK